MAGNTSSKSNTQFKQQLNKIYGWYTGGFLIFIVLLAILEQRGLQKTWIGFIFLAATARRLKICLFWASNGIKCQEQNN